MIIEAPDVGPGRGKWLRVLQTVGLVDEAWRPARGTYCFVSANGIAHEPEPHYPGTALRADWRLDDGTFIEYAGLLSDVDYRARLVAKIERAEAAAIPVLVLTPDDLLQFDRLLGRRRPVD